MIKIKFNNMKLFIVLLAACMLMQTAYALPQINTWQTENGIKVLHVHADELPIIDIAMSFDAGSARDADKPGLSTMMHAMIDKGTGKLSADDVASMFEDVGAQFSVNVDLDRSSATLRSLSDKNLFDSALDMYIDVVAKPSFPQRDFDREKNRLLISLEDNDQRPSSIVSRTFFQMLYEQHPYAQPTSGTKGSVAEISLNHIKEFHREHIVAMSAVLAIVGDISLDEAEAVANEISKALPRGKKKQPVQAVNPSRLAKKHIDFPSKQAHVRMGQIGIERGNPDYFNLYVGNHVLGGGGFTSRLVEEVRSKRGLSYSVYSYFLPYQQQGPFMLGLQTLSEQAAEAIQVCEKVLTDYIENGPTEEELALSKQSIINGFPLRIDSNKDLLGYLSLIGYYNLPLTYVNDFINNIEQVTLADVKQAISKHLDLDSFVTVVVGSEQASKKTQ